MTTLANMRTLVRNYLDDSSSDTEELRWSDTEIDFALEAALEGVIATVAQKSTHLDQTSEAATSSGVRDISALKPLLIRGVEYKTGNTYVPLLPTDHAAPSWTGHEATLRITYVGKPTFPTNTSSEMTYGGASAFNLKSLDRLVGVRAALDLLPKDGERNQGLEQMEPRLWEALDLMGRVPRSREMVAAGELYLGEESYASGQLARYRWAYNPGTMTLTLVA